MFRIKLGRTDCLTTVSLPIHEYVVSLSLCRSFQLFHLFFSFLNTKPIPILLGLYLSILISFLVLIVNSFLFCFYFLYLLLKSKFNVLD